MMMIMNHDHHDHENEINMKRVISPLSASSGDQWWSGDQSTTIIIPLHHEISSPHDDDDYDDDNGDDDNDDHDDDDHDDYPTISHYSINTTEQQAPSAK